ncbi:MAG: preprotein translocase subunit SecE [Candidatus Yanofskybacteria bacterium RIFCSPLOWO2_01_FULL_49_25]|uniref:Protein translocase subunit SecE n=1 Tax=Candidatus Yanofskybacteria bacterium RIFCSPLOWO2_01_FULL_49_25 TaxID=1802701 RepID=A0A1F8GTT1_9BACT|nr:MAG: preprotein translocase subunit SecE [Candidatus Yanofskybacteria bacterium RIFCSPLOWO2_01_FULL_49_25]
MERIIAFLRDVRVELAKVTWPTRRETVQYTLVVIGMGIGMALLLGVFDLLFQTLLQKFILHT